MTIITVPTPKVACVFDLDNILHRGTEKGTGRSRPQGELDLFLLQEELKKAGVTHGTVCRNREFSQVSEKLWEQLGYRVLASRQNCDPEVIKEMGRYADAGASRLILVSGDGGYFSAVKALHKRQIPVEVWTRRKTAAERLVSIASKVKWLDAFVTTRSDKRRRRQMASTEKHSISNS